VNDDPPWIAPSADPVIPADARWARNRRVGLWKARIARSSAEPWTVDVGRFVSARRSAPHDGQPFRCARGEARPERPGCASPARRGDAVAMHSCGREIVGFSRSGLRDCNARPARRQGHAPGLFQRGLFVETGRPSLRLRTTTRSEIMKQSRDPARSRTPRAGSFPDPDELLSARPLPCGSDGRMSSRPDRGRGPSFAAQIVPWTEDKLRPGETAGGTDANVLYLIAGAEIARSVAVAGSQHRKTIPAPPRDLPVNAAIPP
jgi:hypothetical protein